jgi:hypothetical protein
MQARVIMTIDNFAAPGGVPSYLVVDQWGRFALANRIGQEMRGLTGFMYTDDASQLAFKVAGGDPMSLTHPKTLLRLAVAVLGYQAELAFAAKGVRVTDGLDVPGKEMKELTEPTQ